MKTEAIRYKKYCFCALFHKNFSARSELCMACVGKFISLKFKSCNSGYAYIIINNVICSILYTGGYI